MKNVLISTLVLAGFLVLAPTASPQAPQKPGEAGLAPIPGALDAMLAVALKSNPDILLADAKVREAQAALNAARLKVTQDVVKAFHDRSRFEITIAGARGTLERMQKLARIGKAPVDELEMAKSKVVEAEIDLRQWEAQVRYLLGLDGLLKVTAHAEAAPATSEAPPRRPEMPAQMKNALMAPFVLALKDPQPIEDMLESLAKASGLNIVKDTGIDWAELAPINLSLKDTTILGAFVALIDMTGGSFCFVVRDYGLLITTRDRAVDLYAPTIPSDVYLSDDAVPPK